MADKDGSVKEKEADEEEDEHEEGEISDEELPPTADASEEDGEEITEEKAEVAADAEGGRVYGAASPSTSRRADDTAETPKPEARLGQSGAKPGAEGFRVSDMDATIKGDGGDSLRNAWGVSGYSLYHLAWAQGVSGRANFSSGADSPTIDAPTTSKPLSERLSGLGDSGSWGTDNYRRLSKSSSRDSDFYGRFVGRGAEEGDEDLSPLRENGSNLGESRASARGRRTREASWSEREGGSRSFRHSGSVLSRLGKIDRDSMEDDDYSAGGRSAGVGDEKRLRKQRSASNSSMERTGLPENDSVKGSSGGDGKVGVEDKEEGELEEGEIELGSSPEDSPPSPSKDAKLSKQRSSVSTTATEYWSKEKSHSRAGSGVKARVRPSAEDHSYRRHRQKRLFTAGDLVRNVTVKDAQKSFVDVCNRLLKALRILDELQTLPPPGDAAGQEGRTEGQQPREVTALARQAFQGIRAVYAVRNTASGREQEQERDRNVFPRLLELANGYCQKLFSPKQARELEGMMDAVANSARLTRVSRESSSQHLREQQLPPAPKTVGKNQNPSDPLASKRGNNRTASVGEISKTSETKEAERMLVFDEAAALAAAALAYAKNPENAARALSLHGKKNNLSISAPSVGADVWKWPSGLVPDNQSTKSLHLPTTNGYNIPLGRYPNWTTADQRGNADAYAQAPSQLADSNREAIMSLGYNKVSGTYGVPQAVWDNLNRPQFAAAGPSPMLADNILSTPQGKPWSVQQPEGHATIPTAYMRQLSADFLANPNVQRVPVVDDDFERLPSPTPDEGEEAKRDLKPSEPALVQNNGTIKNPVTMMAPTRNLTRSHSVDQQGYVSDLKISKDTSEELTPKQIILSTTSSTTSENLYPLPPKGMFRSRDPRRRAQGSSLDMTSMPRLDQVVQEALTTEAFKGNSNKRQFMLDTDERQDTDGVKRLKRQTETAIYTNGGLRESHRTSSATGGWLDDSPDSPSGSGMQDTAMELDDEGPIFGQDTIQGADPNSNANGSSQQGFPTLLNGVVAKKSTTEFGQQAIVEVGSRAAMRPRDPRRVLVDGQGERDIGFAVEKMRTDDSGVIILRKSGEVDASNSDSMQAGIPQFDKVATLASRFAGKAVETAATTISNSSLQPNGIVVKSVSNVVERADMGMEPAASEISGTFGEPTGPPEFAMNLKPIAGPRKPKGPSCQWGASQVHPGLEQLLGDLSEQERKSVQLERQRRMAEQDRMFSAGKLCLVLDLDHTLLNSAKFSEIEPEWDQRLRGAEIAEKIRIGRDGEGRRELYRFPHMSMWTKLRPGIWKFLARASQLYELHVYTMGNKVYATEMAKLLDPTGKLFAGRVISKGDDGDGDDLLPKSKDLDGVLGMESAVVIIDDSARVWPHHSENLIVVERYMYFPCSRRQFGLTGPSLLEVGHDERESDGMLASALGVIARIHENFFKNPRLREVDVREILADQKRQVLGRCKVVFSRVFPVGEAEPHRHPLWRTAEQFGAICTGGLDEEVTHVVAISLGTDKVNWAIETGRHVVRPAWIEASTILYRRANERDFPVLPQ